MVGLGEETAQEWQGGERPMSSRGSKHVGRSIAEIIIVLNEGNSGDR
jgi:hypothetical protein